MTIFIVIVAVLGLLQIQMSNCKFYFINCLLQNMNLNVTDFYNKKKIKHEINISKKKHKLQSNRRINEKNY